MKYYVVDAFAEKVFEGNPAGVCIMEKWLPDDLMQNIAIENNLSETAFAVKERNGYHLRWFTPGGEIDLCGHATLATAYILMRFIETAQTSIRFNTMSGELTVNKKDDLYELDFPIIIPEKYPVSEGMIEALGVVPEEVYKGRDLIFLLKSEDAVRNLTPDFEKLKQLPGLGVFVTGKGKNYDYVARAFFPRLNINEDPVTGAMQCSLVPFWTERLEKTEMVARQVSQRGGTIYCKNEGDRVKISGRAVLYSIGDIFID
ncbi:PhzF family phenazine biosynthesis protein [Alkalihalophilus marmarensis]|uniref:PhzF family phenazine biosynthesis protein n=1 Tax=Alkalihalophilus marmarensis TaxID=521377 RepID=UPI002E20E962|nr:PhzF family phenazine biosynthesis protein [Alkalihalophilus marmarensis]